MKYLLICVFVVFFINNSNAHDFWLESQPFYSKPDKNVDIAIFVGEELFGDTLPNNSEKYSDFSYSSAQGRKKVLGEMGRYPAGYFKPQKQGYYVIGYRSNEDIVNLPGEKFNSYLRKEGLDKIINYRSSTDTLNTPAKEVFSRCVKTFIKVGDNPVVDYSGEPFGYTFELTPLQNPYNIKIGKVLQINASYLGKASKGSLIVAFTKESPKQKQKIRTDKNGNAAIVIDKPGIWIIKSVNMIKSQRSNIDWESFWASITFKID